MYLSASEAAQELGVSVQTIYAYVSRGLIRAEKTGSRSNRYLREDIEQLKARKAVRRNPAQAIEQALHWGAPILESSLTLIQDGRFFYRGWDATELAQTARLEEVAALLWTGETTLATELFAVSTPQPPQLPQADLPTIDAFGAALPLVAAYDYGAYDLRPSALPLTGARVLKLLAAVAADVTEIETDIATSLGHYWGVESKAGQQLLTAALILCADHELNVSSFTARCVASAGATLYGVVSAGMAALQGLKHGKMAEHCELLLSEIAGETDLRYALGQRLRRGEAIPGFGHVLYPAGDPRGRLLLDLVHTYRPYHPMTSTLAKLETIAQAMLGEAPTLDLGLAAVTHVLGLPKGSALVLFAIGRSVGWIGHAIEQYAADQLIRPRARYTGLPPQR